MNFPKTRFLNACLALAALFTPAAFSAEKLKALIVDGQNNHVVWPKSTIMMKTYLEETGLFEVEIARTQFIWKWQREKAYLPLAGVGEKEGVRKPKADPEFSPEFEKYDLVVSNFGWNAAGWPDQTKANFEKFVNDGGGFVAVHAADNSWPEWKEFNKMIGIGGWGDRTEEDGPYVYFNDEGEEIRDPQPGICGKHGPQNEFLITMRNTDHPITTGLPDFWMHSKDECYSHLRGPAENMTVLATASDSEELKEAGRHEPMLMVIDYGKGRVFHTTLGHDTEAFEGVGFITTFQRGAEWAATGEVTQAIPKDFPGDDAPTDRAYPPLAEP